MTLPIRSAAPLIRSPNATTSLLPGLSNAVGIPFHTRTTTAPRFGSPSTQAGPSQQAMTFVSGRPLAAKGVEKPKGDTVHAQPKILNVNPPSGDEQPEEVKQHNREMDARAEKAGLSVSNEDTQKDKVNPKFWPGKGGQAEGR